MKNVFVFFWLLLVVACKSKEEKAEQVVSKNKLEEILTDLYLYKSYEVYSDSLELEEKQILRQVLKKHKVKEAQYKKTIEYYSLKPEKFSDILDEVQENIYEFSDIKPEGNKK
ncbi:MAG: hypothetical protein C4K58_00660 [Flavobacteriaceae bacterium]|nr:MAG: hypothetical protein C4K58_00660 [Flavobacteriaceae bacterium]